MTHLVLLSGWGIDARIWRPLAPHWPADITLSTPDWPGYGNRPPLARPDDLDALASAMSSELRGDAVWVGWSLGGLLAAAMLERLPAPRALVVVGMNASFTAPDGVTPHELQGFCRAFARAPLKTWRHFLRRQLAGEPVPHRAYQQLEGLLGLDALPAGTPTLKSGLEQLATLNLHQPLGEAPCPILRLRGDDDPLLPRPDGNEHAILANSGHCPQLSVPRVLAQRLSHLARHPASPLRQGPHHVG